MFVLVDLMVPKTMKSPRCDLPQSESPFRVPAPSGGGGALPWSPVLRIYSVHMVAEKVQPN